jgi:hypothetical protein
VELTTESLQSYIGTQVEIYRPHDNTLWRGELKVVTVDEETLRMEFEWLVRREEDNRWHYQEGLKLAVTLRLALIIVVTERVRYQFFPGGEVFGKHLNTCRFSFADDYRPKEGEVDLRG